MPNIIELNLLENKSIVATMQGYHLGNENSYKIIAGEENATIFKVVSMPYQYAGKSFTIEMVNAKGYGIEETPIGNIASYEFSLPVGMAVAGYAYVLFRAKYTENGKEVVVPFQPLKIKVWNTIPEWKDNVSKSANARLENGYLIINENGTDYNLGYVKGEKGDSGDIASQKIIDDIQREISDLYLLSNATVTGTEEVTQAYQSRQTANGLSGLIDGALTRVTKIRGDTVVVDGALKHASFYEIKSTGKNLFTFEDSNIEHSNCSIEINSSNDIKIDSTTTYDAIVISGWRIRNLIVGKKYILSGKATIKNTPEITRSNEILISSKDESGSWIIVFKGLAGDQNQASFNVPFRATANTQRMYFYSNISEFAIFTNYSARLYDIQVEADEQTEFTPYVEDIYQLSEPVALPKWDYIDVKNKKIVRYTQKIKLTGNEFWGFSTTATSGKGRWAMFLSESNYPFAFAQNNVICNIYKTVTDNDTWYNITGISDTTSNNHIYFYDENCTTTVDEWKAYIKSFYDAGTPIIVEYRTKKVISEEDVNVLPEKYMAWNKGTETVLQGKIDNSEYGANNKITQVYAVKKGV